MSDAERVEIPGGFLIMATVVLPEGRLEGQDTHQYVNVEYGVPVTGSVHTLRATWLDGEQVTDPGRARDLWAKAGWL